MKLITLLSDFGQQDVYVGVMKGVIAQIDPSLSIIDLTHDISPQNVLAARFNLMNAYPYFPAGTVHVAVVDPGVGGERRAIAVQLEDGFLVGPDNGLLSGVIDQRVPTAAVELTNPAYWRSAQPSSTFHGRDIFAPAGAHLARGIPLAELGQAIELSSLRKISLAAPIYENDQISGTIQFIDHFGNLVTNIPGSFVQNKRWSVFIENTEVPGCGTYGDVSVGTFVALVGSHGWVEIAVSGGSAQSQSSLSVEDTVTVLFRL